MEEYKLHTPSYYLNKSSSKKTAPAVSGGEDPKSLPVVSDALGVDVKVDTACLDKEVESYFTAQVCFIMFQ